MIAEDPSTRAMETGTSATVNCQASTPSDELDEVILDTVLAIVPRLARAGAVSLRSLRASLQSCIGAELSFKKPTIKKFAQMAVEMLPENGSQATCSCGKQLFTEIHDDVGMSGRWRGVWEPLGRQAKDSWKSGQHSANASLLATFAGNVRVVEGISPSIHRAHVAINLLRQDNALTGYAIQQHGIGIDKVTAKIYVHQDVISGTPCLRFACMQRDDKRTSGYSTQGGSAFYLWLRRHRGELLDLFKAVDKTITRGVKCRHVVENVRISLNMRPRLSLPLLTW